MLRTSTVENNNHVVAIADACHAAKHCSETRQSGERRGRQVVPMGDHDGCAVLDELKENITTKNGVMTNKISSRNIARE